MDKLVFQHDEKLYSVETEKPKGDSYFYQCVECRTILPSNPNGPVECACGNIALDPPMFKMGVENYKNFRVLKIV